MITSLVCKYTVYKEFSAADTSNCARDQQQSVVILQEQDSMSAKMKSSLKDILFELQCHFTWTLREDDLDPDSIEEKLHDQIGFLSIACKHRMYSFMAYLKHLRGDNNEAIVQLRKAEAYVPKSEDAEVKKIVIYGNYAWIFFHQRNLFKSRAYVEKVKTILKKYESPPKQKRLLQEIYSEQGWAYFSFSRYYYEKAMECFEKAIELDPENPELNSGYALAVYRVEILSSSEVLPNKSFALLERAVDLNPNDTSLKSLLALQHHYMKNDLKAAMLINEVLQEDPDSPYALRYVGKYYNKIGFVNEAIAIVKKAINLTPTSCYLHYLLGSCYRKMITKNKTKAREAKTNGQPTGYYLQQTAEALSNAIFHYERAVELKKTFVAAYIQLADTYVKAKEFEKAEETFYKALAMKNITGLEEQDLHLKWSLYELYNKNSESQAVRHLKMAIMIKKPTKFRFYAIENLKDLANKMIERNFWDATGYSLRGFIDQQEAKHESAAKNYRRVLQLEPDNQEYIEALSACNQDCAKAKAEEALALGASETKGATSGSFKAVSETTY